MVGTSRGQQVFLSLVILLACSRIVLLGSLCPPRSVGGRHHFYPPEDIWKICFWWKRKPLIRPGTVKALLLAGPIEDAQVRLELPTVFGDSAGTATGVLIPSARSSTGG